MAKLGKRGLNPGGLLSTQEVASVLQISHPTLLKLLREKRVPEPQRVGGVRHWNRADVEHARVVVEQMRSEGLLRRTGGRR